MIDRIRLTGLAFVVVLASCAAPPPERTSAPAPAQKPVAQEVVDDPAPQAAPSKPVSTATLPAQPEVPVNDDPGQFLSQGPDTIAAALGDPALIRRDGPAEVWQFKGQNCILDVYMYVQNSGAFLVQHVELRGSGLSESTRRNCLAEMLRDQVRKTS